jgi:hypothetical protein
MEATAMRTYWLIDCVGARAASWAAAGLVVFLHVVPAFAATINDNAKGTCIAIEAPNYIGWEPAGAGRQYKFASTSAPYTPACSFGCLCSNAVMFGLTVEGTGTWDGQGQAVEFLRFIINWHPIALYNGDWFARFRLACPKDPWLNAVTCKLTEFTRFLPGAPSDPQLYTAFGFSAPYPKTKIPPGEQQAIRTIIAARAVFSVLKQSITITKPASGALAPKTAPLGVAITNPYKATVNLDFLPKAPGSWAGFTLTTKGTSAQVPAGKFMSTGIWTLRARLAGSPTTAGGDPSVDFLVVAGP